MADRIYSEAQAARGATAYETSCANCHRADLGGNTGPALREQRFAREFAGKDLKTLYTTVKRPINPDDLKSHNPPDFSHLRTVCANPSCRRPLE